MSKVDFSDLIGQHVDLDVEDDDLPNKEDKDVEEKQETKEIREKPQGADAIKPEASKSDGKLTKAEAQKSGGVTMDSYKQYIWNGGTVVAILVLILHIISQSANVISYWWLTYWTSHPGNDGFNIGIFSMLVGCVYLNLDVIMLILIIILSELFLCFALYESFYINPSHYELQQTSTT